MEDDAIANAQRADKLNALFAGLDPHDSSQQGECWSKLWNDGRWLPFERGRPNPALEDALLLRSDILGTARNLPLVPQSVKTGDFGTAGTQSGFVRRNALVPGCGRGYDVFLLSSFGWDVTGLEISRTAVTKAEEERRRIETGDRVGLGYETRDLDIGAGSALFAVGDFFQWSKNDTYFDLIYDYTFLSALPPSLRPAWASSMSRLLGPQGRLICVEFPSEKAVDSGGPPWALPEDVYLAHLSQPGELLPYENHRVHFDEAKPVQPGGLERISRWRPERTHAAGTGKDWVSVWRHVSDRSC